MTQAFRLKVDPPILANMKPVLKIGQLVFDKRDVVKDGKRYIGLEPGPYGLVYGIPVEDLEPYSFSQPKSGDFEALLRYYLTGHAPLPNVEALPIAEGLNRIAYGSGIFPVWPQSTRVLIPSLINHTDRPEWARAFVNHTQSGFLDGTGVLVWYRPNYGHKEEGDALAGRIVTFALCKHDKVVGAGANPQRGWHPGRCRLCDLDMTVDSGD